MVQFSGWNKSTRTWVPIGNYALNRFGHADWVESGTDYPMYRLTCTPGKKISVFAASWLEAKGLSGTKDIASFASSESGFGAGKEFLVYVPQPGVQGNVRFNGQGIGNNGHLFIYGHVPGTTFTVVDADTQGRLFSRSGTVGKGGFANIRMNATEFAALNKPAQGLRPYLKVTANHLVTVMVTNFNDNWMTFTPSVVLPNPIVRVTSDSDTANVGSQTCLTVLATNEGAGALTNGLLEVPLDSAVTYVSSDWSIAGMGAPQITTVPETGGQLLTWEGYTIPAGGRLEGTICFTVNPRRANNSIVKNRDFLSFPVLMRGLGTGVPVEQGGEFETFTGFSSVVLTVNDTAQTNVSGLAATPAGNSINVTWLTGREPDLSGFRVYRSTSGDGPFTRLTPTPIPGTGDALTGASYLYRDTPSNLGALYYYRLELIDDNGVSSFFGPVSVLAEDRTPPAAPTITNLVIGDGVTTMNVIGGDADGDLKGYQIFRSDVLTGTYTRLSQVLLLPGQTFTDSTAGNGRTFFYKAKAVDTNSNTSDFSAAVEAVMPSSASAVYTVAYEDQVGPGKNDWDYNDWVVQLRSEETFAQGGVSAVNVNLESVARGARYRNAFAFRFKANGPWNATVSIFADRNATEPLEVRELSGAGLVDLPIFADTVEALPPAVGDDFTNTLNRQNPSTLGRVARIAITLSNPAANPSQNRHRPPFDPYLTSQLGEVHQVNQEYPNSTEVVTFWPTSPLLGFNLDYVLAVPAADWRWPLENQKIWDAYPTVFARHMLSGRQTDASWYLAANRATNRTYNWFPYSTTKSSLAASAVGTGKALGPDIAPVANFGAPFVASPKAIDHIEGDGLADTIVLASSNDRVSLTDENGVARDGWPLTANSYRATAATGRLTPDSTPVLITGEERYDDLARVQVWDLGTTGTLRWEAVVGASVKSAPVIADLEQDGSSEVLVLTSEGQLHVFDASGNARAGSPVELGDPEWNDKNILLGGAPLVADIDLDGSLEIFAVTPSGLRVHGLNANLASLPGWPRTVASPLVGGLTAARVSGTGGLAIVAAELDGTLNSWDVFGRSNPGFPIELGVNVTAPVVAYADVISELEYLVVASTGGRVHLLLNDGTAAPGWPVEAGSEILASPVVGDLDGDAILDVLVGTTSGQVMAWTATGTLIESLVFKVPGAIQATPLLVDLDLDARVEIYIATSTGDLVRFESEAQSPLGGSLATAWASLTGISERNASSASLVLTAAPDIAQSGEEILQVLLGITTADEAKIYDVIFDGVLDAADVRVAAP